MILFVRYVLVFSPGINFTHSAIPDILLEFKTKEDAYE
jgi:hypothetical protein